MKICVIREGSEAVSETFIDAHVSELPDVSGAIYFRNGIPCLGDGPVLSQAIIPRGLRKLGRILARSDWNVEIEKGVATAISKVKADVVLAEYGMTAVKVQAACERAGVPFVAHFHGYDASVYSILNHYAAAYRRMFAAAAAVIAVSRAMEEQLLKIGCDRKKLVYCPYGIKTTRFCDASPQHATPTFLSVGRFVDKKAPHLTILAFARVLGKFPEARLRMIGEGPLLHACQDLTRAMQMEYAVEFLNAQPHGVVQREMRAARAFVQHSITAASGDSEGTPVAVLEACASGLPVISTRHAGIPDVVVDGKTGLLVEEHDVEGMAGHMLSLASDSQLAGDLGRRAASRIAGYYTMEQSIGRLVSVLQAATIRRCMSEVRHEIERGLPGGRAVNSDECRQDADVSSS